MDWLLQTQMLQRLASRAGHADASARVPAPLRAAAILDPSYDHYRGCDVVILRLCRALLLG